MSQLYGEIPYNLGQGISWNAVIKLAKSRGDRRQVIAEIGGPKQRDPGLVIYLTAADELVFSVRDQDSRSFETPPAAGSQHLDRMIWLRAEIVPVSVAADGQEVVTLQLAVDDDVVAVREVTGRFSVEVVGRQSVGAALNGGDPATFDLAELVLAKNPLTIPDKEYMRRYLAERYKWGRKKR